MSAMNNPANRIPAGMRYPGHLGNIRDHTLSLNVGIPTTYTREMSAFSETPTTSPVSPSFLRGMHYTDLEEPGPMAISRPPYTQVVQELEIAKLRIQELEIQIQHYLSTAEAMEKAYTILAQAQPSMLNNAGMQDAFMVKLDPEFKPLSVSSSPPVAHEPDPVLHKDITFWQHDTYKPYGRRGAKQHLGKSAEGVDIYLEHRDGTVLSKAEYSELRLAFKRLHSTLVQSGAAAATWRTLGHEAHAYMSNGLRKAFDGFGYCEDGWWKLNLFGTLVYPDYARDRDGSSASADKSTGGAKVSSSKVKGKKRPVTETNGNDSDIEVLEPPNKRAKTSVTPSEGQPEAEQSSLHASESPAANPLHTQSPMLNTTGDASINRSGDPGDENTLAAASDRSSSHASHSTVTTAPDAHEIPDTATDAHTTPATAPAPHTTPTTTANVQMTPTASAVYLPEPTTEQTDTGVQECTSGGDGGDGAGEYDSDEENDYTTNPAAACIDRAGEPPPNLLANLKSTLGAGSTEGGATKKAGKPKLMKPSDSRTPRNIYAVVFMKENPEATTKVFDTAWKQVAKPVQKRYKAIFDFAATRAKDESIEAIIEAFGTLSQGERAKLANKKKPKPRPKKKDDNAAPK